MHNNYDQILHARALQADILAAPGVWLPRRAILLEWLSAFLVRSATPHYELGATEAADLGALDHFLRKKKVPAAA